MWVDIKCSFSGLLLRATVAAIMLVVGTHSGYAQCVEEHFDIYFRPGVAYVEPDVADNKRSLERLSQLFESMVADSVADIKHIEIDSWTSPEPGEEYNKKLSERRSNSIRDYILERCNIPDSLIVANGNGVAWGQLRELVEESEMQYCDEVLEIIDSVPLESWGYAEPGDRFLSLVDSRQKHLMDLRGGRPYRYMYDSIFPQLRCVSQQMTVYNKLEPVAQAEPLVFEPELVARNYVMPYQEPMQPVQSAQSQPERIRKPLFALKTNLLYDLLITPNIEIEVPIKSRWSVAGEWIFPWWVTKDNGYALEILSGSVEGRYWFGDRSDMPQLTGWFGGLYAGGGIYDLQWKGDGYQGEFYIAAGLAAGYAHPINKSGNLRLEYSLGVGYLQTNYRYYEGRRDNQYLVWQYDGKYRWLGPTKAKVSLVWMLFHNRTKGGAR